ncbi:Penicillin-binding protein [Desulfonema limicola]|uniref:peptidoglycan glycosyltransferase n=1 Tax=Desulfonema limicola TaxID=45656 RepID=A0A975B971_9BACT|nr:Penicillin-binding protein [Desulfonema limicola]
MYPADSKYFHPAVFTGFLIFLSLVLYTGTAFIVLDKQFPFYQPEYDKNFAVTVVSDNGTPLRSFPDTKGVWRYPVNIKEVSPLYIQALINYEDRYFRFHPGVNPLALVRALFQFLDSGRFLSGGSTLTMQAARILHPHTKDIKGKSCQMFRAFQLEYHFTKDEILNIYLNYAPFGGPIEGVQAASFAYLGKSALELSHAEAALLAVLPQSPSRMRPDRHPDRASRGRNKVLDRMAKFGIWDKSIVKDAKMEKVLARFEPKPMTAPLLARRLKSQGNPFQPVRTFIDPFIQETVADLIYGFTADTPEHTSGAAIVVENKSLKVRAYVGSADFFNNSRFGHVDMVGAIRSPGSTLKPFLYAIAMEEGLIHSESLLVDAPFSFSGYRPDNFTRHFSGPVSASEALCRSLNLPAVDIIDRIGPKFFDTRLRQGGLKLQYPNYQEPNLTMILGGAGTSLEDLVSAYTAFARGGMAGELRFTQNQKIKQKPMLTKGAAYIIRQILEENPRPDLPAGRLFLDRSRQAAWKTGTSYGFRDAWTIGITDQYTIGVWTGRPDGTPSPGQYGRAAAAPLFFSIVDSLPRQYTSPSSIPDTVSRREICWPLGIPASEKYKTGKDPLCHRRRMAWILNNIIPPAFPDRTDELWQPNPVSIMINPETGLRVDIDCPVFNPVKTLIARWPRASEPWLSPELRRKSSIPPFDPRCSSSSFNYADNIKIMGIEDNTIFRPPGSETRLPSVNLMARGGKKNLYWLLNGRLIARSGINETCIYQFKSPGQYQLTVMDQAGNYDFVQFTVISPEI